MKFEFLGYYASIWAYLEHLDGGKASEILTKSILVCIDWIFSILKSILGVQFVMSGAYDQNLARMYVQQNFGQEMHMTCDSEPSAKKIQLGEYDLHLMARMI